RRTLAAGAGSAFGAARILRDDALSVLTFVAEPGTAAVGTGLADGGYGGFTVAVGLAVGGGAEQNLGDTLVVGAGHHRTVAAAIAALQAGNADFGAIADVLTLRAFFAEHRIAVAVGLVLA